jgi:hypothetical protein
MWCKFKTWLGLKLLNIANRFCGIPGPFDKINLEVQNTLVDKIEVAYKINDFQILEYKLAHKCSEADAFYSVINILKEKIEYDLCNKVKSYISFYTINEHTTDDKIVGRLYVGKPNNKHKNV